MQRLWVVLLSGALACSGSGLSKTEARKGVEAYLADFEPFCIALPLVTTEPPWVVSDGDPQKLSLERFEALGLLAAERTTRTERGFSALGSVETRQPATEFAPTPYGQTSLVKKSVMGLDAYCFRYARAKVHEVVEWTEPAQQLGVVVSHVTFTIALESAATWVENPSFAESFPKAKLELETLRTNPRQQTTTLLKTNNGWRPATSKL